jgi:hypothetical protein
MIRSSWVWSALASVGASGPDRELLAPRRRSAVTPSGDIDAHPDESRVWSNPVTSLGRQPLAPDGASRRLLESPHSSECRTKCLFPSGSGHAFHDSATEEVVRCGPRQLEPWWVDGPALHERPTAYLRVHGWRVADVPTKHVRLSERKEPWSELTLRRTTEHHGNSVRNWRQLGSSGAASAVPATR